MRTGALKSVIKTLMIKKIPITPMIWGVKGIGKSSVVRQAAKELDYAIFDIRLAQVESVDVKGMPYTAFLDVEVPRSMIVRNLRRLKSVKKLKTELGKYIGEDEVKDLTLKTVEKYLEKLTEEYYPYSVGALHHYSPDWFITALTQGKCVIFFDELNRANRETRQSIFEIILDRTLNNQKLPDNVFVIGAGNPANGNYDAFAMDDSSLQARFLHIKAEVDFDDWKEWALSYKDNSISVKNIDPTVLAYLTQGNKKNSLIKPQDGNQDDADLETFIGFKITADPRRWEFVSILVSACAQEIDNIGESVLAELITGLIGSEESISYMLSRGKYEKEIYLNEVLEWTAETEARAYRYSGKVQKDTEEANKGVVAKRRKQNTQGNVEEVFPDSLDIRADLLYRTVDDIKKNIVTCVSKEDYIHSLANFISIIPEEFSSGLIKTIMIAMANWKCEVVADPSVKILHDNAEKILKFLKYELKILDRYEEVNSIILEEQVKIRKANQME